MGLGTTDDDGAQIYHEQDQYQKCKSTKSWTFGSSAARHHFIPKALTLYIELNWDKWVHDRKHIWSTFKWIWSALDITSVRAPNILTSCLIFTLETWSMLGYAQSNLNEMDNGPKNLLFFWNGDQRIPWSSFHWPPPQASFSGSFMWVSFALNRLSYMHFGWHGNVFKKREEMSFI
jgi:hypothetical protein